LFIPGWYVSVASHGGNDAGWGKLLTRPPELSSNSTNRDIWKRVGGVEEGGQATVRQGERKGITDMERERERK
jgi:hypothetical protein